LWRTAAEENIWQATDKDISAYFCAINRNKKSITLNIKQKKGQDILFRLVKNADVVSVPKINISVSILNSHRVDNFVPGKMEAMGIGYDVLRKVNPSIVHASVSGQF
jgi:succinate--hydroxymethylglutarate CoA-transferase